MKAMVRFLFIASVLCFSTAVYAADDIRKLALEHLELTFTKQSIDATIQTYVDQMAASYPNVNKEEVRQKYISIMGWDVLREPIIDIVARLYTAEELIQINAFYKTPAGQAYAAKFQQMSVDVSGLIAKNLQDAMNQRKK